MPAKRTRKTNKQSRPNQHFYKYVIRRRNIHSIMMHMAVNGEDPRATLSEWTHNHKNPAHKWGRFKSQTPIMQYFACKEGLACRRCWRGYNKHVRSCQRHTVYKLRNSNRAVSFSECSAAVANTLLGAERVCYSYRDLVTLATNPTSALPIRRLPMAGLSVVTKYRVVHGFDASGVKRKAYVGCNSIDNFYGNLLVAGNVTTGDITPVVDTVCKTVRITDKSVIAEFRKVVRSSKPTNYIFSGRPTVRSIRGQN